MRHGQWLRITLLLLGLIGVHAGTAFADFAPDLELVPEPGTLTLLASGAAVLGGVGWLRRRKK